MLLVAIDGLGGAGKTTLAERLVEELEDASAVHMDDFYAPMSPKVREALSPRGGYERYFDWQRLEREVLLPLSRGTSGRYSQYDWEREAHEGFRDGHVEVEPNGTVIVEGVYSSRPELRRYFDVLVFVATPREERLRRMQARHRDGPLRTRWMAAEDWYVQIHPPETRADVVVSGV